MSSRRVLSALTSAPHVYVLLTSALQEWFS